jgi:hypothetical protein
MSIVPAIIGMDNFYDPYQEYAHTLSKGDIGKKIMKVKPALTVFGGPDCSFTGDVYTLQYIEHEEWQCERYEFCGNTTTKSCGRCGGVNYCSKRCQVKDWRLHKAECGVQNLPKTKPIKSVIIVDLSGNQKKIDSSGWPYAKQYFDGWVAVDDIKDVKPDTTISNQHINQLKRWEKGLD